MRLYGKNSPVQAGPRHAYSGIPAEKIVRPRRGGIIFTCNININFIRKHWAYRDLAK